MESWGIPGPIIQRPNMVAPGEGTEDSPNLSAEDGTENTESVLSDGVTNAELGQRTNKKDTMAAADCLEWKWGGNVVRTDQCKWAQAAPTRGVGAGKRRTGRPKNRWADTFKRVVGGQWSRISKTRYGVQSHNIRKSDISRNS
jgi:hypothetical protein